MRGLPAKILETHPYSIFYAVLLANAGTPEDAAKLVEAAESRNPPPGEAEILAKAHTSLRRRGFEF